MSFATNVVNLPQKLLSLAAGYLLPAGAPNQTATGTLAIAPTDAVTLSTDTLNAVGISLVGTPVGASVIIEGTMNGSTWDVLKVYPKIPGALGTSSPLTTAGDYAVDIGALKQVRARLNAITSGSFTATLIGTAGISHIGVKNGNAVDLNATVVSAGTVGTDYSVNKPTIPNVGAVFGNSGPYANYVLIQTVPALPTRNNVDIENTSGGQIAVVRDDGTAANGSVPNNASVFPLGGGSAVGAQGGSWSSQTFKGRLQIYAPASGVQVAVMVD